MSAFNKFKDGVGKSAVKESMRNVALRVTGYSQENGRDLVHGVDIETGQEVSAFLRPLPEDVAKSLRMPRPEVPDFVAEKGEIENILSSVPESMRRAVASGIKSKTEPGGVIILENVFEDKKAGGALSARWMTSAFKYEGSAQIMSGVMARINPARVIDEDSKKVRQTATLMLPDEAKKVNSAGELTGALVNALSAKNGAAAMVRVSDGASVLVAEISRGFFKALDNNGVEIKDESGAPVYVQRSAEETADVFLKSEVGKAAVECADGDLAVEVIPMLTMAMGSATKAGITKESLDPLMQYDRAYRVPAAGKNGFARSVVVFYPNKGDSGSPHAFTLIKPTLSRAEVLIPEGIPTANISVASPVVKVDHPSIERDQPVYDHSAAGIPEVTDLSDFEGADVPRNSPQQQQQPQSMRRPGLGM